MNGIAVDRTGVTVAGRRSYGGGDPDDEYPPQDVIVAKLNKRLTGVVFSRVLGGGSSDAATAVATDASGAVFLTGYAVDDSVNPFPTTPGAFDTTLDGAADAFVVKLSPLDGTMIYGTFLGGPGDDGATGISVDAAGRAVVVGWSLSATFPVTPDALDGERNGGSDAFMTVLSPDGSALAFGTLLGGSSSDTAYGVALDGTSAITVVGITQSPDFPQVGFGERVDGDVFIVKIR